MPIVTIEIWEGRPPETKRSLGESVTSAVAGSLKCPKEHIIVIVKESPKNSWTIGGQHAPEMKP